MKKDKHILINYRMIVMMVEALLIIFLFFGFYRYSEPGEREIEIFLIVFFSILMILLYIFEPHYCVITYNEITIGYIFGLKERAEWREIRKIWISTVKTGKISRAKVYNFVGIKGSKIFFMDGDFYKSKKMTKLLEQYAKNKLEK